MSLGRVIGILVVILVLFAIISDPQDSAATTRNGASNLAEAGSQITLFLSSVVSDLADATGSSGAGRTYPDGGVETGDGSTTAR